jgi:hypothetical protein
MNPKIKIAFHALPYSMLINLFTGSTQSKRNEKFLQAALEGKILRLYALFKAGVEINCKNEYGQTALIICSNYGYISIVELLLKLGADIYIHDNAGNNSINSANSAKSLKIFNLIQLYNYENFNIDKDIVVWEENKKKKINYGISKSISVTSLIDSNSNHPGAGSFYIDNAFSEDFMIKLEELFKIIPVEPPQKISCSERSYFCDLQGWVISSLELAVSKAKEMIDNKYEIFNI